MAWISRRGHIRNDIILSPKETKRAAGPRKNSQERGGGDRTISVNSRWTLHPSGKRRRHSRDKDNDETKAINSNQRGDL